MSSFAYSVAIKLSVANLASQGVKLLAKDLMAAHGAATNLQSKLSALKLIAVGYGTEKVGQGILGFLHKATDASKDYTHQLAIMNASGFTHKEVAQSIAAAWKTTSQVITSSAQDNLESIRELRSSFGKGEGMEHAYAILPQVARAQAIMESLTGKSQKGIGFEMVKGIEFATKGAVTVAGMSDQMERMTKALVQFQGTLTASDFHNTFKQMASMAPYASNDFKYLVMPTLMQEYKAGGGGAQKAGTALATLTGTIKGHAIQKKQMQAWIDAGLINPAMVVKNPHDRTASKILPGAIAGENLFTQNPLEWAQRFLVPARDKLMNKNHLDDLGFYYSITGNRNSAMMMQTLINKLPQVLRDAKLIKEGPSSVETYNRLLKLDPQMAEKALHSQWQNLLAIIGYQILPKMLPFMVKFAEGLNTLSTWMARHPRIAEGLIIGLGSLGVALDIAGKVLMTVGIIRFLGGFSAALPVVGSGLAAAEAGAGGFIALLTGPVGLVIALGLAGAALAYFIASAGKRPDGTQPGKYAQIDENDHKGYRGASSGRFRTWVPDAMRGTNKYGHWEGIGANAANHMGHVPEGTRGLQVNPDYTMGKQHINAIYSGNNQPIQITTPVSIDGRVVATAVTKYMNKAAGAPRTGGSSPDYSMTRPSVASA